MKDFAEQTEKKKERLAKFQVNQERWLHSKDFLLRGEIAEKDMLYLRPVTEALVASRKQKKNE